MTPLEQEDERVRAKMQALAKLVDKELPIGWGFVVLCFSLGEDGRMNYVANARRNDVVRAMYEFIEATKAHYGEHEPDPSEADNDAALAKYRQAVAQLERQVESLENQLMEERERPE